MVPSPGPRVHPFSLRGPLQVVPRTDGLQWQWQRTAVAVDAPAGSPSKKAAPAPVNFFALNYMLLAVAGIWPPEGLPRPAFVVYIVYSFIFHFAFFVSFFTYNGAVLQGVNTGALTDIFIMYLTIFKIYVLLTNKPLIRNLVEALKFDMDVKHPPLWAECRRHEEGAHRTATKLTFWYYMVLLSVDFTYIYMFLRAESNNIIRIPQWDPLSLRTAGGVSFLLYACIPMDAALLSGIYTTVFDTMILSFSIFLGAKIDNLARLLRTLETPPGPGAEAADGEVQAERLRRLHDAVRLHQRIIRFVDELESALSSMSLAQLLESLAAICLQAYRLTTSPPSLQEGVPMIIFLMWLLLELWILCWSGENIATKSKNLMTIAGRCHWMGAGRKFSTDLRMVMMRAERPLCLTGMKVVKLNYPVYLDIVKNSYSMYTCMLRMKNDDGKKRKHH